MSDIVVPPLGESVTEATIAKWLKQVGDIVQRDELIVYLQPYLELKGTNTIDRAELLKATWSKNYYGNKSKI